MFEIYKFLPYNIAVRCVLKHKQSAIENNFYRSVNISDIFYERTWSLSFIERVLLPEHTVFWDHVSVWYEITPSFANRNIDNLNMYNLYKYQNLPKSFFRTHKDKINWVAPGARDAFFANL